MEDNQVPWDFEWPDYNPIDYTDPKLFKSKVFFLSFFFKLKAIFGFLFNFFLNFFCCVLKGPDPDIDAIKSGSAKLQFNAIDNKMDRTSFHGKYEIVDSVPRLYPHFVLCYVCVMYVLCFFLRKFAPYVKKDVFFFSETLLEEQE